MAIILCIETSATVCSVALCKDGITISQLSEQQPNTHSKVLTVLIEDILNKESITVNELSAVAVSSGPGSYTGLRIGVSVAKGLCYGAKLPLISVPSLEIIAAGAVKHQRLPNSQILICPMMDARRMEVYSAIYDTELKNIKQTSAEIIDENSYKELLQKKMILFAGDGAEKCRGIINHPNALFANEINPSAKNMAEISYKKYSNSQFEDVAYFEPFYLKEFMVTTKKKKIL